jgi:CheY-like chemotaxis protein
MERRKVLWADDEIDLLKAHIIFLGQRGYDIISVTNGEDAIQKVKTQDFDVIFLDEMMAGKTGLETLSVIKTLRPDIPVIMITKSEEERVMEEAIGAQISDYLTKPVNPSQILSALKKATELRKISQEKMARDYVQEFHDISQVASENPNWKDWIDLHVRMSQWEVELDRFPDLGLDQSLIDQKSQCNIAFAKYVEKYYSDWVWNRSKDKPPLSVDVVSRYLVPLFRKEKRVLFIVIDCLRLDQWLAIEPMLYDYFQIQKDYYYSILPTATPYSRNALFSGKFPGEMEADLPEIWQKSEDDELSANRFERQLLDQQLEKKGIRLHPEPKYVKIIDPTEGSNIAKKVSSYFDFHLVSMVFNFVDMLGHSRTSSDVLKEMVPHEAAYRSVLKSWLEHSSLLQILKAFASQDITVVITSDHGSVRGMKPAKVISDREASPNMRYKFGRNLKCDSKQAVLVSNPEEYRLPRRGINTTYLIAKEYYFFVYPDNFNKFANLYKGSFFHGGMSMEEMILPVITMTGKR